MLSAAIVGLGWWGKQIVTCLAESDKIRIVRGVDVDAASVREFADDHGLALVEDYQTVLDDPAIDAVILATPHGLHERQVLDAAEAGKQIFCEKPLALSAEAAERMLAACDARGIVLGIGHERRFEGALDAMKRLLDDGDLGTLIHLECNWSHNNFASAAAPAWRKDPAQAPAGTLTALGVHITDYFQSLAGPVERLSAWSAHRSPTFPNDDVITVQFQFASGATGTMSNIATTPFYSRINVFGDRGWAEARENSNVDIPEPATLTVRGADDAVSTTTFEPTNTVRANMEEWADAAEGRGVYRNTVEQKLHNVQILEAIVRSVDEGRPVDVGTD